MFGIKPRTYSRNFRNEAGDVSSGGAGLGFRLNTGVGVSIGVGVGVNLGGVGLKALSGREVGIIDAGVGKANARQAIRMMSKKLDRSQSRCKPNEMDALDIVQELRKMANCACPSKSRPSTL